MTDLGSPFCRRTQSESANQTQPRIAKRQQRPYRGLYVEQRTRGHLFEVSEACARVGSLSEGPPLGAAPRARTNGVQAQRVLAGLHLGLGLPLLRRPTRKSPPRCERGPRGAGHAPSPCASPWRRCPPPRSARRTRADRAPRSPWRRVGSVAAVAVASPRDDALGARAAGCGAAHRRERWVLLGVQREAEESVIVFRLEKVVRHDLGAAQQLVAHDACGSDHNAITHNVGAARRAAGQPSSWYTSR